MNELATTSTVLVAIGLIGLLGMAGVFAAPWSRARRHGAGNPGGSRPQPIPVRIRPTADPDAELFRILDDARLGDLGLRRRVGRPDRRGGA